MNALIAAAFFQAVLFNGGIPFIDGVTFGGPYPVEITEASGCSDIWADDELGGGVVTLFDNAATDHRVTASGACQYATETLEEAEAVSLP